jgi:hypothetical protein
MVLISFCAGSMVPEEATIVGKLDGKVYHFRYYYVRETSVPN